jgi:hypothetical protein
MQRIICFILGHDYLPIRGGMQMCNRCGKFNRYVGVSGAVRRLEELEIEKEYYLKWIRRTTE